jgi:ABC-type uncharacterized transport system involved in gliding motility auxiliary subunit
MKRSTLFFASIITAIILCISANLAARTWLYGADIDLTEDKLFTVSPETKTLLSKLEEPLHLRLFFTPTLAQGLPVFQSYHERVQNLLEQYRTFAKGNITLEYITPAPFTEEEDMAVSHGLEGVQVDGAGSKFYFGLSVENSTDDRGVMPFFDPERAQFLEYDLTKLITDIAKPKRKVIGLLSYLPVRGGAGFNMSAGLQAPSREWAFLSLLEDQFEVRDLNKAAEFIEDDVDIVLLIHPHHLPVASYYALEQFLLRGGKAMIFMDAHVNLPYQEERVSELEGLLKGWGITFEKDSIIAKKENAIHVQTLSSDSRLTAYPKITWLQLDAQNMAKDSVITAPLAHMRLIESGYFTKNDASTLTMKPLLFTQENAASLPAKEAIVDTQEASLSLYNNYVPNGKAYPLAVQLSGDITPQFSVDDLEIKEKEIAQAVQKRHLSKAQAPLNVIMVADTDILRDEFWARTQQLFSQEIVVPEADNGAFVLNAMEFLAGDNLLAGLRSRGTKERRFLVLDDIRKNAEEQFRREEQMLKIRLKEMEARLKELQSSNNDKSELFTAEQTKEITSFKALFVETRRQLRTVQRQLNEQIKTLGNQLAWCNILIAPALLLLIALFLPRYLRTRYVRQFSSKKEA